MARLETAVSTATYDPVSYAKHILKIDYIWKEQARIQNALLEHPHKVLVLSAHNVGKTFIAASTLNWFYDTFPSGAGLSTAPTSRDVNDLLWKEVRLQRFRAGLSDDFIGPSAPEMRTSADHYCKGFTARKGESFQGRHDLRMLFVFDEATGIDALYWHTVKTMFKPEHGHFWLAICNPTDTTSQAFLEDLEGGWKVIALSALDHPNITEALAGRPPPIPAAVSLSQVDQWVRDWCEQIPEEESGVTDIEWPPGSGKWHRPGPIFEARALGRWPSAGTYGVWSDLLWSKAESAQLPLPMPSILPQLGCDVARFGDDWTTIHTRWDCCSIGHEAHNGWDITRTAARLRNMADALASGVNERLDVRAQPYDGRQIPIKVDDDGVGGGVTDLLNRWGYRAASISAGTRASKEYDYPNKRCELWFELAERARHGKLDLHRLERDALRRLRQQAMAPEWKLDPQGRRVVERKEETKRKIGRSPDDMDAMNLSYYEGGTWEPGNAIDDPVIPSLPEPGDRQSAAVRFLERMR
jgi:hypothetical protein